MKISLAKMVINLLLPDVISLTGFCIHSNQANIIKVILKELTVESVNKISDSFFI